MFDSIMDFFNVYDHCTTNKDFFIEGFFVCILLAFIAVIVLYVIALIIHEIWNFHDMCYDMRSRIDILESHTEQMQEKINKTEKKDEEKKNHTAEETGDP